MKRAILPMVVSFVVLLTACTSMPAPSSESANLKEAAGSSTVQAAQWTAEDLKEAIGQQVHNTELKVLDTTNVGDSLILVDYSLDTNGYALYNAQTKTAELLPVQDVELKKIVNENYFIFEDRGEYTDSAFRFVPSLVHCFRANTGRVSADTTQGQDFITIEEDEAFDLDRSIQFGSKDSELLASMVTTFDGFEILFKSAGENDAQFYADATDTPTIKTAYDSVKRQLTFEISTDKLAEGIHYGTEYMTEDNLYIESYKLLLNNGKTDLILTLRDTAARYTVKSEHGPLTQGTNGELPYLSVTFLGAAE